MHPDGRWRDVPCLHDVALRHPPPRFVEVGRGDGSMNLPRSRSSFWALRKSWHAWSRTESESSSALANRRTSPSPCARFRSAFDRQRPRVCSRRIRASRRRFFGYLQHCFRHVLTALALFGQLLRDDRFRLAARHLVADPHRLLVDRRESGLGQWCIHGNYRTVHKRLISSPLA